MVICSIISMVSFKAILADSKSTLGLILVAMELMNDFNSSSIGFMLLTLSVCMITLSLGLKLGLVTTILSEGILFESSLINS